MGQSADATIAWGIMLHEKEGPADWDDDEAVAAHEALGEKLDDFYDSKIEDLLGWTESHPGWPENLRGKGRHDPANADAVAAREALIEDWERRRDEAVPVDTDHYGSYDYGGTVLVFKRTKASVNWGCKAVDPAQLTAPPTAAEQAKAGVVLDYLGFTGDREPRLLLFAMYG